MHIKNNIDEEAYILYLKKDHMHMFYAIIGKLKEIEPRYYSRAMPLMLSDLDMT